MSKYKCIVADSKLSCFRDFSVCLGGVGGVLGVEQSWEQRLPFSSESCSQGSGADVLRGETLGRDHVPGREESDLLTSVSAAHRC